jgi:hypothetical protein
MHYTDPWLPSISGIVDTFIRITFRRQGKPGKVLLQLTVFAAAPVETNGFGLFRFKFRLTFHAQTNAGNRFAASFRNNVSSFHTVRQALATGQTAPDRTYRVI